MEQVRGVYTNTSVESEDVMGTREASAALRA